MKHFSEKDIMIEHSTGTQRAAGTLQITHIPTGLSVVRKVGSGPVVMLRDELLDELAQKVAAHREMKRQEG